jgi:hypothetical protein
VNWRTQKGRVERLSMLANEKADEALRRRAAFRLWRQRIFGGCDVLVWSFAAGTLWGLAKIGDRDSSQVRRTIIGITNASALAWRLANRSESGPVSDSETSTEGRS